jgi:hypothetical protein
MTRWSSRLLGPRVTGRVCLGLDGAAGAVPALAVGALELGGRSYSRAIHPAEEGFWR